MLDRRRSSAKLNAYAAISMPFVPELNGIRALAILIVLISHLGNLGRLVPGGLGVTVFFFLSGFLITSLLRAEAATTGRIDLRQFYIRRTLRIFPPLYITLAFSGALVALGVVMRDPDWPSVTAQLLFVSNYARWWGWQHGLPGPPLWSLAVEEHFYLVFPAVFSLLLIKLSGKRAALTCAIFCLVPLAFRLVNGLAYGEVEMNYFMSHTRIDSILFGCCLALWHNPVLDGERAWKPGPWAVVAGLGAILFAALIRNPFFADTWRYTIQGAGMFVAFAWVLHGTRWTSAILNWAPLQLIGLYSYSIYLVHWLFIGLIKAWSPIALPLVVIGAGTMALSMLYAAAMFYAVERPLYRMRHRRKLTPEPEHELIAIGDPQPRAA